MCINLLMCRQFSGSGLTILFEGGNFNHLVVGSNVSTVNFTKEIPEKIVYKDGSPFKGSVSIVKRNMEY